MAFSRADGFTINDSAFVDVGGNYDHREITSNPQSISLSGSVMDPQSHLKVNGAPPVPSPVGSHGSNVGGNQINNVITYVVLPPGDPRAATAAAALPALFNIERPASVSAFVSQGLTAVAMYDFKAVLEGEMDLVEGERIEQIITSDDEWWYGVGTGGKRGIFPRSYVTAIKQENEPRRLEMPVGNNGVSAIAIYDFDALDDDDISFSEGDRITHIEFSSDNWWEGTLSDGRRGLFPSTYVQL
ncbi:hypothetical protein AX17_006401 [Amanita inopinata Kibby_2008]|nr:hypothetical protein AX17_006401 [Amanita inopinata Kibby_2008]